MITFTIKLLILLNPFGCLEKMRSLLKIIPKNRSLTIIVREWAVALTVMLLAAIWGKALFSQLGIGRPAIQSAGGCALFISALTMLFPQESVGDNRESYQLIDKTPFIVPIAIPQMAGPGILTNIVIQTHVIPWQHVCQSVLLVAFIGLIFWRVLVFEKKIFSQKILTILDRLMGFLFITISIDMIMSGIKSQFCLLST